MKQLIQETLKVFIIFIACTFLFYFALHFMQTEYDQIHRYDAPEGPSVKVYETNDRLIDRIGLFFWLGE